MVEKYELATRFNFHQDDSTLPSSIKRRNVLVTGAIPGLGREASRHTLALGASTVILGVHSFSKGEAAKSDIESTTHSTRDQKVFVWPIDLESSASIKTFADRVWKHVFEGAWLGMAIMNAGIAQCAFHCVAQLVLAATTPANEAEAPLAQPHLVVLTSDIHKSIKFPERYEDRILRTLNKFDQWERSQSVTERYGATKLMDIFIAMELAQLLPRDEYGIPLVVSDLLTRAEVPWIFKLVQALIARTVEERRKTLLRAGTEGFKTHGKWLENQVVAE
ncbi:NAD(P)-binding protein [Penicillium argentinense]|uniref:NAD(P)-binding protein n=1 Tax=Penicillium argentinense TaxID=1131581 RepID=A0A9W9FP18_9EURO|nr:NAD(P)-binding protein [Penicillium argentinense]KAJ5103720.1 NAD(P)-binding protein [Penicillium argentinense]